MDYSGPKPRFKHDCENCTFIGLCGDADLYVCNQCDGPSISLEDDAWWVSAPLKTFIGRFSDNGPDYVSCPTFIDTIHMIDARLAEQIKQGREAEFHEIDRLHRLEDQT